MVAGDTRVIRGGYAQRTGRPPIAIGTVTPPVTDTFVSGTTLPTLANTGYRYPLDAWSGTTGTFTMSTPGAVYDRIDFGSTWIDVKAANVTIRDCKFRNTKANPSRRGMIVADDAAVVNLRIEFCEFVNAPGTNKTPGMTAATGHDFTFKRNNVRHFSDCVNTRVRSVNIDGNVNVSILDNYLTDLSWWYDPTEGVVHPSDTKTHNDCIQHEGGQGLTVKGNYIRAKYSTTVGTFGAIRTEIVEGNGAYPNKDGGSLSAIMVNSDRGIHFDGQIHDNWIGGGNISLNAGDSDLRAPFGTVYRNRCYRDQRAAGWAIGIESLADADCGEGTSNRNVWIDNGTEVARKNG